MFHIMKGNTYQCVADTFINSLDAYNDTGDIHFNNSYLSGIYTQSSEQSDVIDSISFQFTSFNECSFIIFGFETPDGSWYTRWYDIVIMTLYWARTRYQCSVIPYRTSTYYSCNTLHNMTTLQCDASTFNNSIEYGLQIDAFDDSKWFRNIDIERVVIKYVENDKIQNIYIFEYFCFNQCNETQDTFKVDHTLTEHQHAHPYNLLLFNRTDAGPTARIYNQNPASQCIPNGHSCISKQCPYRDKYILVPIRKTWVDANVFCEDKYNSSLATFFTKEEQQTAVTISNAANYTIDRIWIGLSLVEDIWTWIDGSDCEFCQSNDQWIIEIRTGTEHCAVLRPGIVQGGFSPDICTDTNPFLCNNPTYNPTSAPTQSPTQNPINILVSENIIIINHENITMDWIAFNITNVNTECGGTIVSVAISDSFPYEDAWINYTSRNTNGYYIIDQFTQPFTVPISVKITKA
eukprot:455846_1